MENNQLLYDFLKTGNKDAYDKLTINNHTFIKVKEEKLPRAVSAFANRSGGWFFVGVNNDGTIKYLEVTNGEFYYQVGDKIYRAYKSKENKSTLLLELDNIETWKVQEGEIILLKNDTLYSYTDVFGLRKIIKTNELKYNYQNIYQIGIFN